MCISFIVIHFNFSIENYVITLMPIEQIQVLRVKVRKQSRPIFEGRFLLLGIKAL